MTQPRSASASASSANVRFGVDIGGTGIKGAPVDLTTGQLLRPRVRLATPHPATPQGVAQVVNQVVQTFDWSGPVGATFPAAVKNGIAMTAANVDKTWIGTSIETTLGAATGCPVTAVNDADAAGVAEVMYGAGRGQDGVVIMTTFGTGIGTALFLHGQLVPNTELGHLEIDGKDAEKGASEIVREKKGLSWKAWAKRVDKYMKHLEALFWPDLIIVGGGASRKADKFLPLLTVRTPVVAAALENDAGIVGAAVVATGDVTRPQTDAGAPTTASITTTTPTKRPAKRATAKRSPAKRSPAKRSSATKAAPAAPAAAKKAASTTATAPTSTPTTAAKKTAAKKAAVKRTASKAPAKRVTAASTATQKASGTTSRPTPRKRTATAAVEPATTVTTVTTTAPVTEVTTLPPATLNS